jgi:hypothetical protein
MNESKAINHQCINESTNQSMPSGSTQANEEKT